MKAKNSKRTVKCNPDIVFREEGKEALLFDPGTGKIKVLNSTGKIVWKLINGKRTKKDLEDALIKKFSDATKKQISDDLNEFLGDLEKLGYIGKEI